MSIDVLIFSSLYDFSTDLVCAELKNHDVSFLRINRETLADSLVSHYPEEGYLEYQLNSHSWQVCNPRSVWYRQPVFLRNTPGIAMSIEEQLDRSQWMAFLRGMMAFDNATWVNHPQATYLAESKPYQLRCAQKLGFKIPRTVVTNNAAAVAQQQLGDPLIVKSVDTILLREADQEIFAYTNVVSANECANPDFSAFPSTCQELLQPKLDLRVTVIGNRVYCVSVTEEGVAIEGDWRLKRKEQLRYENYELGLEEHQRCLTLVRTLGLSFGAIDLAVTPDGTYFIEINPTGEWGWLQRGDRPIATDISNLLVRGSN